MKAVLRGGHHLRLLEGGAQLFPAMARTIDRAQHLVHVETYILAFAGGSLQVSEAIERAASRGVTVRLVVDGVGTPALPSGMFSGDVRAHVGGNHRPAAWDSGTREPVDASGGGILDPRARRGVGVAQHGLAC